MGPHTKNFFSWDVEQILKYVGSMKTDQEFSDRFLKLKLTVLLSRTSALRRHEIAYINVRYKKKNSVTFLFSKVTKSWKREYPFFVFQKGQKLYVISCLNGDLVTKTTC